MFRRNKSETDAPSAGTVEKEGGKGRPTPSRREAEAAARARAKVPRTRKEIAKAQRAARVESSQRVRSAMKSGDERYFLARDKGPVRSFIRDFVDSRFSFIELMIPLLLLTMALGYSGNPTAANMGNTILLGTMLLVVVDMLFMRRRMRRERPAASLGEHQGDDVLRGDALVADEVHATAQAQGQDRAAAPEHYH